MFATLAKSRWAPFLHNTKKHTWQCSNNYYRIPDCVSISVSLQNETYFKYKIINNNLNLKGILSGMTCAVGSCGSSERSAHAMTFCVVLFDLTNSMQYDEKNQIFNCLSQF